MRKILVLAASVLFCSTMAGQGLAADDVYVDLSVLDEIGGNNSSSAYGKPDPLFPVIKNTPQFPIVKKAEPKPTKVSKKAEKKKTVKKAKPQKKVEKKKAEKVVIPEKPKKIIQKTAKPEVATEQKNAPLTDKTAEEALVKQPQASVESKAEVKQPEEKAKTQVEVQPQTTTQKDMPFKVEKTTPSETVTPAPIKEVIVKSEEKPDFSNKAVEKDEQTASEQTQPAEKKAVVEPLVPVSDVAMPKAAENIEQIKREIIFAEGSSELDEVAKEKIDAIISSFDNAKANKIAIMAYNYDNGEDVFRKKRQSLNRAIEIRSYLLGKGYKNFSIKVINITDDPAKGNVVEIDELK